MKVLLFYNANLGAGSSGSGIRARLISEGLCHWGAEIHVIASNIPEGFASKGIEFTPIDPSRSWEEQISEAAETFRPDILFGITEVGMNALRRVARIIRRPVAYDLHGLGFIEEIESGRRAGARIGGISRSFRELSAAFGAGAITVANPTLHPILKRINRCSYPVFGMTDVSWFSPDGNSERLGSFSSKIQVLYAGNLVKLQGVEVLLQAIRILLAKDGPFEFTIVGSIGKDPIAYEGWTKEFTGRPVHFMEHIPYEKMPDYYRGADVLVIPRLFTLSTYLAFPQKLLDYMASGRTIVATDIAPHRYALESPPAGILSPPSATGLAGALQRIHDEGVRRNLSDQARKVAVDRYCHLRQTERIYSLFMEITGEGKCSGEVLG